MCVCLDETWWLGHWISALNSIVGFMSLIYAEKPTRVGLKWDSRRGGDAGRIMTWDRGPAICDDIYRQLWLLRLIVHHLTLFSYWTVKIPQIVTRIFFFKLLFLLQFTVYFRLKIFIMNLPLLNYSHHNYKNKNFIKIKK